MTAPQVQPGRIDVSALYWDGGKLARLIFQWQGHDSCQISWELLCDGDARYIKCKRSKTGIPIFHLFDVVRCGPYRMRIININYLSEYVYCARLREWHDMLREWIHHKINYLFLRYWQWRGWADEKWVTERLVYA